MGEVIALLSGTGGMGKSCLTAGLALRLAASGKKVLCVDCRPGFGTLDLYFGMESMDVLSYIDICRGDYPLSRAAVHPHCPTLRFLSAPVRRDAPSHGFADMIRAAAAEFDYVLLNAPAGLEEMSLLCAQSAHRCITLCSMDPASIRTASRVADALQLMGKADHRLVVSRLDTAAMRAMKLTVDDIMDRVGLPLLGLVPEDIQLLQLTAAGKFHTGKKWSFAAFDRIAQRLQGKPVPVPTR